MRILFPCKYGIEHDPPAEISVTEYTGLFSKTNKLIPNPDHRIELRLYIRGGKSWVWTKTPNEWEEFWENKEPRVIGKVDDVATEEILYYFYKFGDKFYYSEIYLTPEDIPLILQEEILSKKEKLKKHLDKIKAKAEFEGNMRHPIPQDIQTVVWNRDGGKCVNCGSNEKLEFDHIIPISKGGSNTARNIQLLCEPCNRSKGNMIGG